ncbi:SDR family NAD(P)-dependent oxidoreductase [Moritella sp. 24]|uniref:type I polyketide synthase n=1 Tax=Moritella sp. 24 TaxID=2746230 RepID=UPI001BADD791|nr:type I polyketide synthase [Moritella sp. 24]QUM76746.1 SDR family NAD(P)-dependent oxidoreductase [Moritella sp. 24]
MAKKNTTSIKHDKDVLSSDEQQLNSRLQECPIAVIGMASVFADAKNLDEFWDNIVDSVDAIIDVPSDRWNIDDHYSSDKKAADKTYCKRGGFIPELDFDPMEFGLPPNILELTDIAQLLSLIVARDVLSDAGIGSDYDHDKIGITLGVGGGQKQISPLTSRLQGPVLEKVLKASGIDEDDREMIIEKFKKAYIGWEENSFPGMLGNVIAGRIANRFDFGGTNCVVDAACAGSLAAIKMAISDLLEYRSEVMISGGVCCDNSPFMYMSFSKTPAFTTNDDIRPFDDDSKGMLVGEGIGMLAFKRLEDAERDGDRIYSVLKGIGTSSDGRFKSIYAPRPDGQAKALDRAYKDAGFAPETCGLIEGHGTGTKAGDAAEFSGLTKHFGAASEQKQHIALGSVKSQIGHTKSAAGSAGMIKAALALHHKILPATIHIDKPSEALDIKNSPLYLNSETRPWMPREDGMPRRAGISSFGFGGTNFHIILEEYRPSHDSAYRLNSVPQTVLVSATNQQGIIAELNNWRTKLAVEADLQAFAFNDLVTTWPLNTPSAEQARLGFVARNANEAIAMIDAALKQFSVNADKATWSVPTGIYYRQAGIDANGKVVALFSGQGSQYVNMGRELTCNFPSMMHSAAAMDKEFSAAGLGQLSATTYPIPVYTDAERKVQEDQLRLTQHAQPAIGCFSVGLFKTFQQAGFKADYTAGHSFGELTALWAAGVFSDNDYMMLARSRGQAMAAPEQHDFDAGKMVAVVGDPQQVATIIDPINDVSIANYNSNNQVVIAGSSTQIAVAMTTLGNAGFKVVPLPVSAAFHTPLVGHAQKPFAKAVDNAKFKAPTIPVFANGTGLVHSSKPNDIKKNLKNHMLESVHFNQEIDNIYADGGRVFIEFGPKNVLTKLVENILVDKSDAVAIAVNANPKQPADVQMRQAALQMVVLGVALENIDPYDAVKRPLAAPKASPMLMKLSAASYVSPKTKKAFADALTDGWTVKQAKAVPVAVPQPQVIEKIVEVERIVEVEKVVEVERIVEVEKIVYVNADGSHATTNNAVTNNAVANSSDADLVASIERSVGQFVEHQQQLLNVHEQFMQGPQDYAKTVQTVLAAQTSNELPESLDRTLSMYNEFQSETLRVHETYLNSQTSNMNSMLNSAESNQIATPVEAILTTPQQPVQTASPVTPVVADKVASPVAVTPVTHAVSNTAPRVSNNAAVAVQTVELAPTLVNTPAVVIAPALVAVVTEPVVASVADISVVASIDVATINKVMLEVVADKTGYPTDMLELSMDMEADLGIDSIKRVEILGAVQELIPDLPELNPEDLAELRTLGEIVDYMNAKAQAVSPLTTATNATNAPVTSAPVVAGIDLAHIQNVMLEVVADKTGYPTGMLELSMDMEADLGIDSIKRVEILGAVQEIITDLPELNPEDLAELRTLGEIVSYMQSKAPAVEVAPAVTTVATSTAVASSTPTIDLNHIQTVMMDVVADKTGYPTDILELGMDMEADLGIDSIKRVEILGAVQEIITDLPELNPEDLAELRTLGEIVSYMQSKAPAATTISTDAAVASSTPTIDLNHIQNVMMEVVADKTGYPVDMLELAMDMEADLGIDSIKRVEILGAVQEIITDLPELNPEDLAELRTLGEIVAYMQSKAPAAVVVESVESSAVAEATLVTDSATAPAIDLDRIQNVMMDVVADKTGYPANMLELAMDMEADLGIDSIKRVEILGAVQEIITDLPELNPEDLAELRTLEEIVLYMQTKAMQSTATDGAANAVAEAAVSDAFMNDSVATITAAVEAKVEFQPAPSATVAISPLSSVTKISHDAKGANALIVADGSDNAVQLAEQLIQSGWNVTALQPSWITATNTQAFAKAVNVVTLNAVDEAEVNDIITANAQLDAVIYLHASTEINHIEYPQASKQGLMLAFLLAKLSKVTQAAKVRGAFMVVTQQGGSLGFSDATNSSNTDLVQSGLNGLVKTLSHEWDNVFCRAVDISSKVTAQQVASLVNDELLDADTTLTEVGYQHADKGVERITLTGVATDSYALTAGNNIDANSVFLVSGGAKGVTAHCVVRIAKEYQSKFILLGRSKFSTDEPSWANGITDEAALKKAAMQSLIAAGDKPTPVKIVQLIKPIQANREIAQTLTAITAAGGQAEYVSADVTNQTSVQTAVKPVIAKFGDITGIIHGAGVLADQFIEQKTLSDFESVYSTKIDGLLSLLSVTEASNIKQLVLFSSAAGFYGNPGQSDYSIANEILNKTAYRFKSLHPQAQVLSFNWGPWDGGMVTPELKRMFDQRGVYIIPLDAGAQLLLNELAANDNRCPQILVGNDLSKDASSDEKSEEKGAAVKKPQVSRLSDALVIKSIKATNSSSLFNSDIQDDHFQVNDNSFLADHMIKGNQVLPTVCAIAWMSDAAQATYSKRDCALKYVGFEDYKLFKGVVFDGNEAADYQIQLSPVTTASVQDEVVRIAAKIFSLKSDGKPVFHYAATILLASQSLGAVKVQLTALTANVVVDANGHVSDEAQALYSNGTLFHGESLQGIKQILRCDEQGLLLACQVADIAVTKQGEFPLVNNNIFANDLVYQAMLVWVRKQFNLGSLPSVTAAWSVYREVAIDELFYLQLNVVEHDLLGSRGSKACCDIQLIGADMQLLAEIKSAQVSVSDILNDMS